MISSRCNIVIMGVSCFDGMASSTRVRNLFEPLISKNLIQANNLVYQKDNREPIGKSGTLNNINFKIIDFRLSNIFSLFGFWGGGMSFIKKSKRPGCKNIIYNYNYADLKNIIFLLYARMIGYKIIIDIIEDNRFERPDGFINKIRLKTSIILFKSSRRFTDHFVAISEQLYKRAELVSKGKVPVTLIPITVNLNYFKVNGYQTNKNNLKIFYGGSFAVKDGLKYLISAFDEVSKKDNGIELILTGSAPIKKDLEEIQAQIDRIEAKDRIKFMGFLKTEDYYNLLNNCDIFCMTRINSIYANAGFPFKLGEFLAAGKAVIATKVGDVPNYLFNDVNALLINPDSVEELSEAIMTIIKNPEKIRSLGPEARRTAETNFDSEKVSVKLLSIFETV
jgi:glycosyltransferase involved in cell wall biosynthesis